MSFLAAGAAALASGIGSALGNKAGSAIVGGDDTKIEGGIQSSVQGAQPLSDEPAQVHVAGSQAKDLIKQTANDMLSGLASRGSSAAVDAIFNKSASARGNDTRDYLAAAFPELNPWERSGAGASSAGMEAASLDNAKELKQMELDNAVELKQMDNDTTLKVAGLNSVTQMRNTDEQVFASQSMLGHQQKLIDAQVSQVMANTQLTIAQKEHELEKILYTLEQTDKSKYGNTAIGRGLRDTQHWGGRAMDNLPSGFISGQGRDNSSTPFSERFRTGESKLQGLVDGIKGYFRSASDYFDTRVSDSEKSGGIRGTLNRKSN